jgi:hypothetical protein
MARNGIRFNNVRINIQAAKLKILTSISMSVKLATRFFEVTENVILQELNVFPRLRALVVETMVLWKTPTISWLKVNTNGSVNFHFCCEGGIF